MAQNKKSIMYQLFSFFTKIETIEEDRELAKMYRQKAISNSVKADRFAASAETAMSTLKSELDELKNRITDEDEWRRFVEKQEE